MKRSRSTRPDSGTPPPQTAAAVAPARTARGERARARLKAAALEVLEREGYHRMRITDVTRQAGMAQGLFYHYFDDLRSLALEVLRDFIQPARDVESIEKDVAAGDWYGRIYAHNLVVVRGYAARPGLMRCLLQMADEDPGFSAELRESYRAQLMWLVELMPRLFPRVRFKRHQALLTVYALAGIGEGLLRDYFVQRSEPLRAADLDPGEIAELLSTLFYRALFLEHPPVGQLGYARNLSAMVRLPPG